jgi:hypothetical protein
MAFIVIDKATNNVIGISDDSIGKEVDIKHTVIEVKGKTNTDLRSEMLADVPEVRHMWLDKESGKWKEVTEFPFYSFSYKDGKFTHNFNKLGKEINSDVEEI